MHSLCENENIPMWGKHIALKQKKITTKSGRSSLHEVVIY